MSFDRTIAARDQRTRSLDVAPGQGRRIAPMPRSGTTTAKCGQRDFRRFCPSCAPGFYAAIEARHRTDRP